MKIIYFMIGIILMASVFFIFNHSFKISTPCQLESPDDTCSLNQLIEVDNMEYKGFNMTSDDLTIKWLDENCNKLKKNYWGCNKYLVERI